MYPLRITRRLCKARFLVSHGIQHCGQLRGVHALPPRGSRCASPAWASRQQPQASRPEQGRSLSLPALRPARPGRLARRSLLRSRKRRGLRSAAAYQGCAKSPQHQERKEWASTPMCIGFMTTSPQGGLRTPRRCPPVMLSSTFRRAGWGTQHDRERAPGQGTDCRGELTSSQSPGPPPHGITTTLTAGCSPSARVRKASA